MKRIIKRRRFIADRDEAIAEAEMTAISRKQATTNKPPVGEYTPLQMQNGKAQTSYEDESSSFTVPRFGGNDDESDSDFFKVILSEIEKVNKFFVG